MTTNANRRVTDEQIERARSIDLVQFLQQYEPPGELKRIGQSWTLKSHDSMRISADGRWNWFSQNKGGGDAIGFLQAVHGMSFQDAVRTLAGEDFKTIPATQAEHKAKPPERTAFALPPKNNGNRRVFAYLHRSRRLQRKSSTTASSMICCMRTHSTTMLCSLARTKITMRGTLFCVGRSPTRTSARKQPAVTKATDFFCAAQEKPCSFVKRQSTHFRSQHCGSLEVWIGRKITILHSAA